VAVGDDERSRVNCGCWRGSRREAPLPDQGSRESEHCLGMDRLIAEYRRLYEELRSAKGVRR